MQLHPKHFEDDRILDYATDHQARIRAAYLEHESVAGAARALNMDRRRADKALRRLMKKASHAGFAPAWDQTRGAPPGQRTRGTSTLYDADGTVRAQWVKTALDQEAWQEHLTEFIAGLTEEMSPAEVSPGGAEKETDDDLLNVVVVGDLHLGMLSWGSETGEDFDLDLAIRQVTMAYEEVVRVLPPAGRLVILTIGDLLHADNLVPVTPAHKHVLDVDSRYPKVLNAAGTLLSHFVQRALVEYEHVELRVVPGNHDPASSVALQLICEAYWRNEPRVLVDTRPVPLWWTEHGKCLIGAVHGDKMKPDQLGMVLASDAREAWGRTVHRQLFTGHVHTFHSREVAGGVMVDTVRATCPRDAYAAHGGWRSRRDLKAWTFHVERGEIARHTVMM